MATIADQVSFERTVAAAHARHQEAIRAATSAFDAACLTAQTRWRERLVKAKASFDVLKSEPEVGDGFEDIRREFDEAWSATPDIEAARQQLGSDVAEADTALVEALAEARGKLIAA